MYLKFSNFTPEKSGLKPAIHMVNKKENIITCSILILLCLLNLIYRIVVLKQFAFAYTDSDQVVMWCGARDFSMGQFHEPAYYGQNYNSMIEALFASLFFKWMTPRHAVPLVTAFLTLFPYYLVAGVCYLKKRTVQAYLILLLPLLLPPEYDLITSMPRGFVTGIFFAVAGSIVVYYPEKKWGFFFFALLNMIGLVLNPNAVLITFSIGLILLFTNYRNKLFYFYSSAGAIIGALPYWYIQHFYELHPAYIVHPQWKLEFSIEYLKQGFLNLNRSFAFIVPAFWYQSGILFFLLLMFTWILFKQKEMIKAWVMCMLAFFVVLTLGINKIYDGDETVFYHYSRMFLSLPLIFALFLAFIKIEKQKWITVAVIISAISFFSFKTMVLEDTITEAVRPAPNELITTIPVGELLSSCDAIGAVCKQQEVELVVIVKLWSDNFINYGCQACDESFPPTIDPKNDRRTWRLLEEKNKINKTILFLDQGETMSTLVKNPIANDLMIIDLGNRMYLLKNNTLTTTEVINHLKLKARPVE
jgi:hypothetical protein